MKNFYNTVTTITTTISGTNESKKMTYADLALLTLNIPPRNGWTKEEMKIRFKIEDKLEKLKPGESAQLEDAEFEKVFECSNQPWQFKHRDLLKYMNDLEKEYKKE